MAVAVSTAVVSGTGAAVKSAEGKVYWITASAAATGGAAQINDSSDDSGNDVWDVLVGANTHTTHLFDPPIPCASGIYADLEGSNIVFTVGYA
jgi:hypothetical protein